MAETTTLKQSQDTSTSMLRVAVGSGNPVKRASVESALADIAGVVEAVPVDSGVSEQPWGEAETIEGATNRARRALDTDNYDLGVGLEGGVARITSLDGLYLTMWATVTDGETVEHGAGPRLRLPDEVAARIEAGEELGPVMDDLLDTENVAEREGAAGALTGNAITRESALQHALAGALGPFVTDYY